MSSVTGIFLGCIDWAAGFDGNWETRRMCGVSWASSVRSCTAEGLGGTKPPTIPVCESDNIHETQGRHRTVLNAQSKWPGRHQCSDTGSGETQAVRLRSWAKHLTRSGTRANRVLWSDLLSHTYIPSQSTADTFGQHPHHLPCILDLLKRGGLVQPQRSQILAR